MNRNLQGLRALAAYGVVAHHVLNSLNHYVGEGRFNLTWDVGATGVDVFFVISGYIMAATTSGREISPAEFLRHRLIRVVPIYWLLTLFAVAVILAGVDLFGGPEITLAWVLRSLFFIPGPPGGGQAQDPILTVGWTLNFEMMFYVVFAGCLVINSVRLRLAAVCAAIVAIWLAGTQSADGAYLARIGSSIILEFALGVALWAFCQRVTAPTWLAVCLGCAGFLSLFVPDVLQLPADRRILIVAPAAVALVYSAVALEARRVSIGDGAIRFQGDASYATYLTHFFVLQAVGKVSVLTGLNHSAMGLALTICAMFLAVGVFGSAFHLVIERPLTAALRKGVGPAPRLSRAAT